MGKSIRLTSRWWSSKKRRNGKLLPKKGSHVWRRLAPIIITLQTLKPNHLRYFTAMPTSARTKPPKRGKNEPPRRRGPRGWATLAMSTHLEDEIPGFRTAQADSTLQDWWPCMHTRFSLIFPTAPLTPEEIAAGITMEDKIEAELKVCQCSATHA